jgi:hypothetical protein
VHPRLGPVVTFDMNRTDVTSENIGDVVVFVTATKLFVRQGGREVRVYDLLGAVSREQAGGSALSTSITPQVLDAFYKALKPWLVFFVLIIFFPFFFVWKLFTALIYSWFGLLINMSRHSKLNYSGLFNIGCFVLTPAALIQMIQLLIPGMNHVPFGLIGSAVVTFGYLFFAIKTTDDIPENSSVTPS